MMKQLMGRGGLAVLSGLTLGLSYEPFRIDWLVWGWLWLLLPLLWTTKTSFRAFGWAYLAGLSFWCLNLKWIATVGPLGVVALGAYLALYVALFGAFAAGPGNPWKGKQTEPASTIRGRLLETGRSLGFAISLAGVWVGLEWLRGWILTGFGWNGLGIAVADSLVLAQNAEFIGATGLSFFPVFLSAIMVQVARRFWQQAQSGKIRLLHWDFAVAMLTLMLALTIGAWRLAQAQSSDVIELRTVLVQQDIPQVAHQVTWDANRIVDGFIELTEAKLKEFDDRTAAAIEKEGDEKEGDTEELVLTLPYPDLVVWPETALLDWFFREPDGSVVAGAPLEAVLHYLREQGHFTLLLGAMTIQSDGGEDPPVWNSILTIDPENQRQLYDKQHRVIFGEYMPDWTWLRWIYAQAAGFEYGSNIEAGIGTDGLTLDVRGEPIKLIPSICFEDTVPRLARPFVKPEPQVIINVTNDGWFHRSEGATQHFANARLRCIELRRPMIRCANRGTTGIISITGSTLDPFTKERRELLADDGTHFARGALSASAWVPRHPTLTLYARWGDWFSVAGLTIGGLWWLRRRVKRTS